MKAHFFSSMIKYSSVIIVMFAIAFSGCNKNNQPAPVDKDDFESLQIDPNFKFETTKEVMLHLEVNSINPQEPMHKFRVFTGNPTLGGKLIASGMTDPYMSFQTTLVIPTRFTSLFIQNQDVNNNTETVEVEIVSNTIHYTFNTTKAAISSFKTVSPLHSEPDWSVYDVALSGNYNKVEIEEGLIYSILPGASVNISNQLNFKGGTLIVAGTITASNINGSNDGGDFYISTGGVFNSSTGGFQRIDNFVNFGVTAISNNLTLTNITGNFENQGIMNIAGTVNINPNSGDVYNSGTMNIAGHYNNNGFGYNMGEMVVSGHFNNNGGQNVEFINDCKLIITGNFNQNSAFYNNMNAYVQVNQSTYLNGSSVTNMEAQSLLKSNNIHFNSVVHGPSASCALFQIANETRINGSGNIDGYIDICDANGIDSNTGTVSPDVSFDCSCFIPTTSCNPGAGTPQNPDTDGDGCPDDQDDYPNDPLRCSDDYYPNETDFTSLAFEDLWTGRGDYDFNDLVVQTNYKIVKNGENKVVEIFGKFHIAAVGASLNNGFGIEFDVPTTAIASVTGTEIVGSAVTIGANGMEQGPINKAVLIVYDAINDYLGTSMVNTVPGGNTMEIDTITVHVSFATPQASIGTPPYNPFMFINQERGKEIHLIDHTPTEMVDASYFGQEADNSDPATGRYYVTSTNLPWVIEIPEDFEWPVEKADILTAYLKFRDWAESSGNLFPDWYQDLPGYRNQSNIYQMENQ
ncbi:MAG: LruC domain-containing protein [Bacteroidetes bacterium]|nr:LruC domain-containing protein [Bacteroidota bacterium]